ncbi:MAG: hypothetical protein QOE92_1253 [Chloroflexota bacterium]|nr:hypothetical protein [Chloroflexota bacterium]
MPTPIRVLVLEDSPSDAELVLYELRRAGYLPDSEVREDEAGFREALDRLQPELILADYNLPQFDALQALGIVREKSVDAPVVIVSGAIGEDMAAAAIRAGAADYLLKDRLGRLGHAVSRALVERELGRARRVADLAMRQKAAQLRAVMDTIGDAVVVADATGRVTDANAAAVAMLGAGRDDIAGLQLDGLLAAAGRDGAVTRVAVEGTVVVVVRR